MTHSASEIASAQLGQIGRLTECDGIDQVRPRSSAAQLDQIGALAVTKSVRPLSVDSDRPSSTAQRGDGLMQGVRGADNRWHALGGRGEQFRFLIKIRCGERYVGQCLRELRLGGLRREGIITTPAGSGGRPASVQTSSAQPAR